MSGGKGGSQSSQVQIPGYMEDALRQQLARAQAVQNMPYAPIMGPTMAGFTSGQKAGMESQAALAQRMGIIPQEYDVASGYMPGAIDVGNGLTAYASYPGAKERVLSAFEESPELARQYGSLMFEERPTYQDLMTAQAVDKARANGTLDALIASGGMGDNGDGGVANTGGSEVPVSGLLTDVGFGLYGMPISPVANLVGSAILDAQIDARAREFEDLPTTTGGNGGGGMGSGRSPSDAPGTPF